jgi:hypothetical protein
MDVTDEKQPQRSRITRNAIRCLRCQTVAESKHRHDLQYCTCGSVFVDGGKSYLRRGFPSGKPENWYDELSEHVPEDQLPLPIRDVTNQDLF